MRWLRYFGAFVLTGSTVALGQSALAVAMQNDPEVAWLMAAAAAIALLFAITLALWS